MCHLRGDLGAAIDTALGRKLLHRASSTSDPDCPQSSYVFGLVQLGEVADLASPDKTLPRGAGIAAMERAAWLGFAPAMVRMGMAWQGGEKGYDSVIALRYFHLASRQQQYLRRVRGDTMRSLDGIAEAEISKWMLCGSTEASFAPNESAAFQFAQMAAEFSNSTAEFAVGYFYEVGVHVAQDTKLAMSWYEIAAGHGSTDAAERLRALKVSRSNTITRAEHKRTLTLKGRGSIKHYYKDKEKETEGEPEKEKESLKEESKNGLGELASRGSANFSTSAPVHSGGASNQGADLPQQKFAENLFLSFAEPKKTTDAKAATPATSTGNAKLDSALDTCAGTAERRRALQKANGLYLDDDGRPHEASGLVGKGSTQLITNSISTNASSPAAPFHSFPVSSLPSSARPPSPLKSSITASDLHSNHKRNMSESFSSNLPPSPLPGKTRSGRMSLPPPMYQTADRITPDASYRRTSSPVRLLDTASPNARPLKARSPRIVSTTILPRPDSAPRPSSAYIPRDNGSSSEFHVQPSSIIPQAPKTGSPRASSAGLLGEACQAQNFVAPTRPDSVPDLTSARDSTQESPVWAHAQQQQNHHKPKQSSLSSLNTSDNSSNPSTSPSALPTFAHTLPKLEPEPAPLPMPRAFERSEKDKKKKKKRFSMIGLFNRDSSPSPEPAASIPPANALAPPKTPTPNRQASPAPSHNSSTSTVTDKAAHPAQEIQPLLQDLILDEEVGKSPRLREGDYRSASIPYMVNNQQTLPGQQQWQQHQRNFSEGASLPYPPPGFRQQSTPRSSPHGSAVNSRAGSPVYTPDRTSTLSSSASSNNISSWSVEESVATTVGSSNASISHQMPPKPSVLVFPAAVNSKGAKTFEEMGIPKATEKTKEDCIIM